MRSSLVSDVASVSASQATERFDPSSVSSLDEPVRRYLTHAIEPGVVLSERVCLTMRGRIKVGRWLEFTAVQRFTGHEFEWRARTGWRRLKPIHVVDRYAGGEGGTEGKILGRLQFLHAADENTARAAAGRGAVESIWVPASLMPDRGVSWRTEDQNTVVASFEVAPERPEVRLGIDDHGGLRSISTMRWGNVGQAEFGYIPFGGAIHAERRFDGYVVPSRITVGWWYGTPRFAPFFEATVTGYKVGQ